MNRAELYKIAQESLLETEASGHTAASVNVGRTKESNIRGESGDMYNVELSYAWQDSDEIRIRVICRITPLNWFHHEQLEEAITLCPKAL